jgi:hypothetical protein
LSEYLAGGAPQLAQKREVAGILDQLKNAKQIPDSVTISVNPRSFAPMLELLVRLLRRGDLLTAKEDRQHRHGATSTRGDPREWCDRKR